MSETITPAPPAGDGAKTIRGELADTAEQAAGRQATHPTQTGTGAETGAGAGARVIDLAKHRPAGATAADGQEQQQAERRSAGFAARTRRAAQVTRRATAVAARYTLAGAGYAVTDAWRYLRASDEFEAELTQARQQARAARRGEREAAGQVVKALREERREVARERRHAPITVISATMATSYGAAVAAVGTVWGPLLAVAAAVPGLAAAAGYGVQGWEQRHPGEPLVLDAAPEPVAVARVSVLGQGEITAALRSAGLIGAEDEVTMVGLPSPAGDGAVEAVFELPDSTTNTAAAVIDKRDRLAKAFRVSGYRLDVREGEHPGQVRIWLATRDPFGQPRVSPLLADPARQDVWVRGVPVGYDRRGQTVHLRLRHVMALLGGMSRTGKGMALRNIICALGLDPRVNIRLVAGAKPGEHAGYAPACATFFGRNPDRLHELLKAVHAEAERREAWLEERKRAKLSERDLDMFPLEVVIIDEFKQYMVKGTPFAEENAALVDALAGFAAALNITLLISTQDPDAGTVPRGYKSNSGARMATRTGSANQTNAILKDGATGAGLRAHDIPESMKGAAIVDMDGTPGELIRSFFIEDEEFDGAEPVIAAGLQLRQACGRAPGQGEDPIETHLVEETGLSSVAGGPKGMGRPGRPAAAATVLDRMAAAMRAAGMEEMTAVEIAAAFAAADPAAEWGPADGETDKAYSSRVGARLGKEIAAALAGTGQSLERVRTASGARGYRLADVETAIGA